MIKYLQYANAINREKSRPAEDESQFHISSSESSSTFDWLQHLQNTQQSSQYSETERSKASRSDHAPPSFSRTFAVPPPPMETENLHLSQMFRTSSSSSQPVADAAYVDLGSEAERSESSDFVSSYGDGVGRKESNFADSGRPKAVTFKVPYRHNKAIAKVSRQETVAAANSQQLDSGQRKTEYDGKYQADNNSLSVSTDDSPKASQKRALTEGNSTVIAQSPYFQPTFSESAAMMSFPQSNDISSSASMRDHVGDTPLALSGMQT